MCGMSDCNTKMTPCNQTPLGSDPDGAPITCKFDYASAVGMLIYLSSNSRPDIQYAVHQCARFTHFPKKSHEDAILRICRYLQGTKDKGLQFNPNNNMTLDHVTGTVLDVDINKTAMLHSTVFEDNNGALSLALSLKMSPRTKHIAIKYHHFRENIGEEKGIILSKIDTSLQKADILTKGLGAQIHVSIQTLLMGW
jgi:hypothetical protein